MLSLQRKLVETCTFFHPTRDRHGDMVWGAGTSVATLFRDISSLRQTNYQEGISIEGLFWFAPSTAIVRGDIIAYNSDHYRVIKVIQGKRTMFDDTTDFIKCEVNHIRQVS